MKNMRKLLAMVLAVVMVMSLATTAFAAEGDTYTITINNETDGHTYEAYQIFTGILSGAADSDEVDGTSAILSDVKWGASVANATSLEAGAYTSAAAIAEKLAKGEMTVDALLELVTLKDTPYQTSTDNGDTYVISGLEAGYYLVKDKDDTLDEKYDAYTDFIMEVVEDSVVSPKSSVPTVEKKILDTDPVDVNEAGVGEAVNYQITGTLPTNVEDYKEYYYEFTDTLSKGLTYNEDAVVTVNGVDVTKYFYIKASEYNETTGTTITVAIQDLLALELLTTPDVGDITKDTKIVITYSATVNENAVINGANPNKVDLEYSNNPNDSGEGTTEPPKENPDEPKPTEPTGKTPEDVVETYVTEIIINKVDGNNKPLNGAKFQIKGEALHQVIVKEQVFTEATDGTYWKLKNGTYTEEAPVDTDNPETENVNEKTSDFYDSTTTKYKMEVVETVQTVTTDYTAEAYVDANGKLVFSGLPAGEFTITEIVTPEGYNTIDPFGLTITFDAASKTFTYTWTGVTADEDNAASVTVVNQAGSTLPETGGMGTTLFYVFGAILMLGAAVLLVTKRRMNIAE